jgi:hypothetical protein
MERVKEREKNLQTQAFIYLAGFFQTPMEIAGGPPFLLSQTNFKPISNPADSAGHGNATFVIRKPVNEPYFTCPFAFLHA